MAVLDPFYFARFYQALDIGPGGTARLLTVDGSLLAETGLSPDMLAASHQMPALAAIARGSDLSFTTAPDPDSGATKLFTVRRLEAYPQLAVAIGLDKKTVMAPVRLRRIVIVVACIILCALIILLAQRLRSANRNLYRLATTDELTGFANRRHFLTQLDMEIRRATRYPQPLSLAIFDLDHFKSVNDTHGHAAGDAVLRGIATSVQATFRETDMAGWLGGEEFAILMPATDQAGAVAVCDRLRLAVARSMVPIGSATIAVTISIGIGAQRPDDDAAALLVRTDRALYQAKHNGRNRIEIAD
jgi:diguanylate cyclase (GGDEF)-like protein